MSGRSRPAKGAAFIVAAALLFACMSAVIKMVAVEASTEMVVFFRNLFGLTLLLPWFLRNRKATFQTQRVKLHLFRGGIGLVAMICFFYAIAHMALAEAVLLTFTAPLFIPLFAHLWLKEEITKLTLFAVPLGFIGIALILKPGIDIVTPAALIALLGGACAGLAMVTVRNLASTEPPTRIVFYFALVGSAVTLIPVALHWHPISNTSWLLLLAVGILATLGQLMLTRGYSHAPAAQVGPFTYTSVIFAALLGWLLWDERLDTLTLAGIILVILAGTLAMRRKTLRQPAK